MNRCLSCPQDLDITLKDFGLERTGCLHCNKETCCPNCGWCQECDCDYVEVIYAND